MNRNKHIVVDGEVKDLVDEAHDNTGIPMKVIAEDAIVWYLEKKDDYYFTEDKKTTIQRLKERVGLSKR